MGAMSLGGACWVLALSSFNVTVQISSPRWVVGRTLALYQTAAFGGMALGSWGWGAVADRLGISEALMFSALAHGLGLVIALRWPLGSYQDVNLEPLNRWKQPNIEPEVQARTGPIIVSIDYQIDDHDMPEFMTLMAARRRIMRRDGCGIGAFFAI
jgi:hypothetical protein